MNDEYSVTTLDPGTVIVELPVSSAAFQAPPVITKTAFRNRFTMEEKRALYTAAKTVIDIQIFLDDLSDASSIHLEHPSVIASIAALVSFGFLTPERGEVILSPVLGEGEAF